MRTEICLCVFVILFSFAFSFDFFSSSSSFCAVSVIHISFFLLCTRCQKIHLRFSIFHSLSVFALRYTHFPFRFFLSPLPSRIGLVLCTMYLRNSINRKQVKMIAVSLFINHLNAMNYFDACLFR